VSPPAIDRFPFWPPMCCEIGEWRMAYRLAIPLHFYSLFAIRYSLFPIRHSLLQH
jgi:hypothetical protein